MRSPSSWRRSLVASALGNAWIALIQIAFVPAYIAILGVEAYGLIGAFAFLLALFWVLDSGVAQAISREVARALAGSRGAGEVRGIIRSVEVLLLGTAIAVVALVFAAAGWIVELWLRLDSLESSSVVAALRILGVQLAFRLFVDLYRAVLAGGQDLVWLNSVAAAFATLRGAGVLPVLVLWPRIEAFFAFQAVATGLEACILGWRARSVLPHSGPATFSFAALGEIHRFSVGATLVTLLCLVLGQADRAVLPVTIPLAEFGGYALSASVATALGMIVGPFATTARLKLNELVARGDSGGVTEAFHRVAQWVTLAAAPTALVLAAFAEPLLLLWTRNAILSAAAAPLLTWLAIAGLLNACSAIPYVLPLAHGRTRDLVRVHTAALALFVPSLYIGSTTYGAIAAAIACLVVAALELLVSPLLLRGILPAREVSRWIARDILVPVSAAGFASASVLFAAPSGADGLTTTCWIVGAYLASLGATALALPDLRRSRAVSLTPPPAGR